MNATINNSLVALAVLVGLNSYAQTSFSLEDAKAHALEHHINILNAQNNIDIAQQQIVETTGIGLPQIEINGQFNHFINIPVQVVDASAFNPMAPAGETVEFRMGTEYSTSGTLQASQLLFNGSYIVGLQVSKHVKSFQESSKMVTQEDVVFNVIQAYQLAAIAKENLAFADSMAIITQELIDKQQHFLELDMMLQEDMDQLSFSLLTAKNAVVSAEVQYENALNLLKWSMGFDMNEPLDISQNAEELLSEKALSAGEIENNLQYNLLKQKITLSEYSVKNNKFMNLPSLYAFFNQTYNAYRNEFNFFADERWYPQTVWGLQLNVPLFSGLQRHARTKQSQIELMKDQNNLTQMQRTLQFQETQIKNNLRSAQNKFTLQKENTALARLIYENAITKEQIGKGTSIVVTQKHNQLMMAQAQYLGSLMELFNAQLELDKLYNQIISEN